MAALFGAVAMQMMLSLCELTHELGLCLGSLLTFELFAKTIGRLSPTTSKLKQLYVRGILPKL
jgi:hypothetical protein